MRRPKRRSLLWYYHLYQFLAEIRLKKGDLDSGPIHTHTVMVLSTGVLMWSYTYVAWAFIASPIPGFVAVVCSLIHLLSPLLFRITNNVYLVANIAIGAALIHQTAFSWYTGGLMSFCVKWYAILPMLAGIICGLRGAITWLITTLLVSGAFLYLHLIDYPLPFLISEQGYLIGTSLIQFGFIFLTSGLIILYVSLRENTERLLNDQGKKIDDLFRVLFHDLANPLGRLGIGLTIARRGKLDAQTERGISIASEASESMLEITQNVRKMYAMRKGKAGMTFMPTSLNECVVYLQKVLANELANKDLRLRYDAEKYHGLKLLVEPVSFKNQVLGNILSNAIKFSNPGNEIILEVRPVSDIEYMIEIRDTGVGMPSHILHNLFDINRKTTRPGTKGETGTGFGMHIMKSFVEIYGGKLEVESVEDKEGGPSGTTFRLQLKGEKTT